MKTSRREFVLGTAGALAATLLPSLARAGDFPDRPLRLIVPFAPGGNVDATARVVSAGLTQALHVSAVVENKPGAGGSIGADMVVRAPADGYTLLVGSNGPLTVNPFIQAHLPYEPLRDFAPVAMFGYVPHVIVVNPSIPAHSLAELVALSKQRHINTGTSGIGSATHLTLMRLNAASGAQLVHVPYRGGGALIPDLLGGSLDATMTEFSTVLPLLRANKVRVIAVASEQRMALAPEIPTFIEAGVPKFIASSYVGLLAPGKTPPPVLASLQQGVAASLADAAIAGKLGELGVVAASGQQRTSAGFGAFLRDEYENARQAVALAGIKPE
ncbi:Bug family tripartite tricarboxylate transporter substrate binding protein [Achromobacter aloeverae]|uniref:Tripartite tricarboxylate transporter substrate binding protein n=1 Tax=Achromobacter aloeverae TaxID=1750518 RepID=A0A4Q1HKQ4_9BURK|nr:tripartite tricarboxylate transporter substrate-binding protein [Achromobacter aloeverae]RXN91001.1 tripartite tricarboxylate transporter substrate binding protein [Achromobacter aloeverae]